MAPEYYMASTHTGSPITGRDATLLPVERERGDLVGVFVKNGPTYLVQMFDSPRSELSSGQQIIAWFDERTRRLCELTIERSQPTIACRYFGQE